MIFVTVGSTDFDDLVERVDRLVPAMGVEVICQIGLGRYVPKYCRYFRFAPSLDDYFRRAEIVVGHGGLGTVIGVIRLGTPFVGVSNPDRPDHHQDEILGTLAASNHIVWCRSLTDLSSSIARARTATFARYTETPCQIHTRIGRFLQARGTARRAKSVKGVAS